MQRHHQRCCVASAFNVRVSLSISCVCVCEFLRFGLALVLIRYAGVLTKNTLDPDVNVKPKSRSTVAYQWTFCAGGIIAEKKMFLSCDDVERQGCLLYTSPSPRDS